MPEKQFFINLTDTQKSFSSLHFEDPPPEDAEWFCEYNKDTRCNSCEVPERDDKWYFLHDAKSGPSGKEQAASVAPSGPPSSPIKCIAAEAADSDLDQEAVQMLLRRDPLLQHLVDLKTKRSQIVSRYYFHEALLNSDVNCEKELESLRKQMEDSASEKPRGVVDGRKPAALPKSAEAGKDSASDGRTTASSGEPASAPQPKASSSETRVHVGRAGKDKMESATPSKTQGPTAEAPTAGTPARTPCRVDSRKSNALSAGPVTRSATKNRRLEDDTSMASAAPPKMPTTGKATKAIIHNGETVTPPNLPNRGDASSSAGSHPNGATAKNLFPKTSMASMHGEKEGAAKKRGSPSSSSDGSTPKKHKPEDGQGVDSKRSTAAQHPSASTASSHDDSDIEIVGSKKPSVGASNKSSEPVRSQPNKRKRGLSRGKPRTGSKQQPKKQSSKKKNQGASAAANARRSSAGAKKNRSKNGVIDLCDSDND